MKIVTLVVEGERFKGRLDSVLTNEYMEYCTSLRAKQIPEIFDEDSVVTVVYRRKEERLTITRYKELLSKLSRYIVSIRETKIRIDVSPLVREGLDLDTIRMGLYLAFKTTNIEVVVI